MSKYIKALILVIISTVCVVIARQLFLLSSSYEGIVEQNCLFLGFFILSIAAAVSFVVALVYVFGGFDNK